MRKYSALQFFATATTYAPDAAYNPSKSAVCTFLHTFANPAFSVGRLTCSCCLFGPTVYWSGQGATVESGCTDSSATVSICRMGLDGGTYITRSDVLRGQSWELATADNSRSTRGGDASTSATKDRKAVDPRTVRYAAQLM